MAWLSMGCMLQSWSAFQVLLPSPSHVSPPPHPQALRHGIFLPRRSQMAHPCCFSYVFLPGCSGTCCFSVWNSLIQGRPVPLWLPPLGLACLPPSSAVCSPSFPVGSRRTSFPSFTCFLSPSFYGCAWLEHLGEWMGRRDAV